MPRLRVLLVHNFYQQAGGEDQVFESEAKMLEAEGHIVERLVVSNIGIDGIFSRAKVAVGTVYSRSGRDIIAQSIIRFSPDIVHFHNFFPMLSPSVFDACLNSGVPSVWTLHNYRISCANGLLFRDGAPCEDCVGRAPISAIRHRCYRGSLAGSAVVAGMIGWHRSFKTWETKVARFIALTEFGRNMAVKAGIPSEKIRVKPNMAPAAKRDPSDKPRDGFIFVGRLSREKGVHTLIDAWRSLPEVSLTVIGDGPEMDALRSVAPANVRFTGFLNSDMLGEYLAGSHAVIVPSEWNEPFGLIVAEAMAAGTPVISSRMGALADLVIEGSDGYHFTATNSQSLSDTVRKAIGNLEKLELMGRAAFRRWEKDFSPRANLKQLEDIYFDVLAENSLS